MPIGAFAKPSVQVPVVEVAVFDDEDTLNHSTANPQRRYLTPAKHLVVGRPNRLSAPLGKPVWSLRRGRKSDFDAQPTNPGSRPSKILLQLFSASRVPSRRQGTPLFPTPIGFLGLLPPSASSLGSPPLTPRRGARVATDKLRREGRDRSKLPTATSSLWTIQHFRSGRRR